VRRKGEEERKTRGVKTFSELARPLTSAYACLCDNRVRAHQVRPFNCDFQHRIFVYDFLVLSNMVSFSSQILLLSLYICSQARYKSGLLYTFFIISFVPVCVFF